MVVELGMLAQSSALLAAWRCQQFFLQMSMSKKSSYKDCKRNGRYSSSEIFLIVKNIQNSAVSIDQFLPDRVIDSIPQNDIDLLLDLGHV